MVQQLHLPNGRIVEYVIDGAPDGFPLVWCHGTPGACLPPPSLVTSCKAKGIKIISLSRAGYGGTTRKLGRRIVDSVADIRALNEHLGIERCVAAGWSGGGPDVLACAARLPGCLAAASVAGTAPYDAEGLDFLAGQSVGNVEEIRAALEGEASAQKYGEAERPGLLQVSASEIIESTSPEVDKQALISDPEMAPWVVELFREALRISCDGLVDDNLAFTTPWGFELSEIKVPVLLYQGSEDQSVPLAHGKWLAEHLPQDMVKRYLVAGEGHLSIFTTQKNGMLDELLAIAKSQ